MSVRQRFLSVVAVLALIGTTASGTAAQADTPVPPELQVTTLASGLSVPWDLTVLPPVGSTAPDGTILFTERDKKTVSLRLPDGTTRVVLQNQPGIWNGGETGMMGIETDVNFATDRAFFTCHGYRSGKTKDVRVVRWVLNEAMTKATLSRNVVTGLPTTSGRHAGCSLTKGDGNALYVGTGDAATGKNPQDLTSGGGKVLRVYSLTGRGYSSNPFSSSSNAMKQRVWTYGHRNVQGVARRADGYIWSVEQGSSRDDEVNRLEKGGNYGWNPVRRKSSDKSYNEGSNSPMTDYAIKGSQVGAAWSSGTSTLATSGGTFVAGPQWGAFDGALAVSTLKDQTLRLMLFTADGSLVTVATPPALDHTFGRLRAAVTGPDGTLYLTTSNNNGDDKILKVAPVPSS